MAVINGSATGNGAEVDANGGLKTILQDSAGTAALKLPASTIGGTDRFLPIGGINDGVWRGARFDRFGGLATAKTTPMINYQLYTAALPPQWLNSVTTMTTTHSVSAGTLLNASAIGTASTLAAVISFAAVPKFQKSPILFRTRTRLVKGGNNGVAEIGLTGTQAATPAVPVNGFVFLYGIDGTLKPTVYMNSSVVAQGTDFQSSINSTQYYGWDIVVDDDAVLFTVQDPNTGLIISEQTLRINTGDPRFGQSVSWFAHAKSWVGGSANVGAATQLYVADISVNYLDLDANKPWPHAAVGRGGGSVVNPTVALTQLANYTNNTAPASATLSNTAAGYTTLGGQFQFAAVAGAETDYALFAFTVPTGTRFYCTGITIDTMNTGAAVATTATWLQWFIGPDATAVTLASNSFRVALGNQVFPIAAAIGAQANVIRETFQTPLLTHSGRILHIGLKMPLGTATASQVIRGIVRVEGYFE